MDTDPVARFAEVRRSASGADRRRRSARTDSRFQYAAARDPDDVALRRAWAASLEKLGKKDEAAAKLEEARRAEPRLAVPVKLD